MLDDVGGGCDDHRLMAREVGTVSNNHSWLNWNVDGGRGWSVNDGDAGLSIRGGTI